MEICVWQAVLVIVGPVGLGLCPCASAGEQPADVSPTHIPHPTELWPIPEDNGWDDFLAAMELLPEELEAIADDAPGRSPLEDVLLDGPEHFTASELKRTLRPYRPALEKLREALNKPFVVPYEWLSEVPPIDFHFPQLAQTRHFARILKVKAAYHQRRADDEQALDSLKQLLTLGANLSHGGLVAGRLVSITIEAIGLRSWQDWIRSRPSPTTLWRANDFLRGYESSRTPMWKIIIMENWYGHQWLEYIYGSDITTEDIEEEARASWPGLDELVKMDRAKVAEEWDRHTMALVEIAGLPISEALEEEQPLPSIEGLNALAVHLFPKVEGPILAQLRGALIMIAIELYRHNEAGQGLCPAILHELVPDYLPELPQDPFTGTDFCYARLDNFDYKLYSVGPNKVDDGGVQKDKYWRHDDPDIVIFASQ